MLNDCTTVQNRLQQCTSTTLSDSRLHAGIKGIWNLRKASNDSFDSYLVLAFVGETRILEINAEDELDEAEIEGFEAEQQVRQSVLIGIGLQLPFTASRVMVFELLTTGMTVAAACMTQI